VYKIWRKNFQELLSNRIKILVLGHFLKLHRVHLFKLCRENCGLFFPDTVYIRKYTYYTLKILRILQAKIQKPSTFWFKKIYIMYSYARDCVLLLIISLSCFPGAREFILCAAGKNANRPAWLAIYICNKLSYRQETARYFVVARLSSLRRFDTIPTWLTNIYLFIYHNDRTHNTNNFVLYISWYSSSCITPNTGLIQRSKTGQTRILVWTAVPSIVANRRQLFQIFWYKTLNY